MAIRDRLRAGAEPFLEPDEKVEQAIPAQVGNPWAKILVGTAVCVAGGIAFDYRRPVSVGEVAAIIAITAGLLAFLQPLVEKRRAVIVTDRAVLLLQLKKWVTKPGKLIARLPRDTRLGPVRTGAFEYAKLELDGEGLWVEASHRRDIEAADAAIPQKRPGF